MCSNQALRNEIEELKNKLQRLSDSFERFLFLLDICVIHVLVLPCFRLSTRTRENSVFKKFRFH